MQSKSSVNGELRCCSRHEIINLILTKCTVTKNAAIKAKKNNLIFIMAVLLLIFLKIFEYPESKYITIHNYMQENSIQFTLNKHDHIWHGLIMCCTI